MNEQRIEKSLFRWRKRNSYYYSWLDRIYKFVVRPHSSVLHVGCECGDLLSAVEPSYGVGIDENPEAIKIAKERFSHLKFEVSDPHELKLNEKFDYILICNSLGHWHDIQHVLENIHPLCHEKTRIVITYYNYLWEGILRLGSLLKFRRPRPYQNWLPPRDIENLLELSSYDVVRTESYMMLPKRVWPITSFCNYFLSLLPGFRMLNLINLVVAKPIQIPQRDEDLFVSVIVPCKNECGNIENVTRRIPQMGRETEIIFVDGNSADGTAEKIEQQIRVHAERKIRLIHQGQATGKADAVRKGFAAAKGDVFVIQDADLTAQPEDLPKFFRALRDGKGEFINGCRLIYPMEKEAMRFLNLLGNKFFGTLFTWLLGQRFRDTLCGTKMISRKNYELIADNRNYFGDFDPFGDFDLIFGAIKQSLKVVEVPINYKARRYGSTSIKRFRNGWMLLKMSWIAFKKIKWLGRLSW